MYCDFPDFTRCCFCLPLRTGVIVFGYLNIVFSILLVGLYSYSIHVGAGVGLVYHGSGPDVAEEVCIALYLLEILVNAGLVYGAHRRHLMFIKIFYYYSLATLAASVPFAVVSLCQARYHFHSVETLAFASCGIFFQGYFIGLVRSLLKKLSLPPQRYENPLQQIVNGEVKNEIYEPSTVVAA